MEIESIANARTDNRLRRINPICKCQKMMTLGLDRRFQATLLRVMFHKWPSDYLTYCSINKFHYISLFPIVIFCFCLIQQFVMNCWFALLWFVLLCLFFIYFWFIISLLRVYYWRLLGFYFVIGCYLI